MTLADLRSDLVADTTLHGTAFCRALTQQADGWLVDLYRQHVGDDAGVALAATGGYGREELCPHSDLDVILIHDRPEHEIADIAAKLWYPIWDEGVKLGHSVRTIDEAVELVKSDLDTATALLSLRWLAGDQALVDKLAQAAAKSWQRNAKQWLPRLEQSVEDRHGHAGDVAFTLEPGRHAVSVRPVRPELLAARGWVSLAAGEEHDVTIVLRARDDLTLWGRVVDAASGEPLAGAALLQTFAELLGDRFTPETRTAWEKAYGELAELMTSTAYVH